MLLWARILIAVAGAMGASGVALAAWAAHRSGGETLMTAALFLLLHATPVAAIALAGRCRGFMLAASALAVGAILFSGDIALLSTLNVKPWALAAPTGGIAMIIGWLTLCFSSFFPSVWNFGAAAGDSRR